MWNALWPDLRHAFRRFGRDRTTALAAIGTLAISIGANTTVFGLVDAVVLRPLPYPVSSQLYYVNEYMAHNQAGLGLAGDYYSLRRENRVFSDAGAYSPATVNWAGPSQAERLEAARVTASFFRTMGMQAALGRVFAEGEEGPRAPAVAVISDGLWRSGFGMAAGVAGSRISVDGTQVTIIGVLRSGAEYPKGTQIWLPFELDESSELPRSAMKPAHLIHIVARARPHTDAASIDSEMRRLTASIREEYPKDFAAVGFLNGMRLSATPLAKYIAGDLRPALFAVSGAVLLVLLVACVNLANLVLAQAAARQREMAVRLALGAPRRRLVRQLLTESLAVAVPGGLAGIAVAALALRVLNLWKPAGLGNYSSLSLDIPVLAFSFILTIGTGLIFGLAPALSATRTPIRQAFSGGLAQAGRRGSHLRRWLVALELAVSLVLLIGAGLLARSYIALARTDLGFEPSHLLVLRVNLSGPRYAGASAQSQFYSDALDRIRSLSMVRGVAVSTDLPLSGEGPFQEGSVQIAGRAPVPVAERPHAVFSVVSPDYFRTMGTPVLRGSGFDTGLRETGPLQLVVNQAFARQIFPGEDAVGRGMLTGSAGDAATIAGVVADIKGSALGAQARPAVYRSMRQSPSRFLRRMAILVRTAGAPEMAIPAIRTQLRMVDREQPVFDVQPMEELVQRALTPERFHFALIGTFALVALALAAIGVYGVVSFLTSRRTREIGVRIALGARAEQVQWMVLRETLMVAAAAVPAGLGAAWLLTRYLNVLLYGVAALDVSTFVAMPVALAGITAAAAYAPARRAAQTDPVIALRAE